jgi:ATP-dependent protease ClpP protease subunit
MATATRRLINWAAAFEDGALIRATFFGLLSATAVILYLDYSDLSARTPPPDAGSMSPILPAFDPLAPQGKPGPDITTSADALRAPLSVALVAGGRLDLTGTIVPGSADHLAAEIVAHGEYIKTVALDSPGGAVVDALAMGRLIRNKGFSTSIAAGALCASSCPLVFAGGRERIATARSAIGVHQIYAEVPTGSLGSQLQAAGQAMSDAQSMTAQISRYLAQMGVDPEVWLRALETPPDRLTYLNAIDLKRLNLATRLDQ